jgi:hypothetical protein
MDLVSRADLSAIGRRYFLQSATKLEPTVVDTKGSNANLYVGSGSFMAFAVARQVHQNFAEHMLDGCVGDKLDRYVLDKTNGEVPRLGAKAAVVTLQMTRPTATAGAGEVATNTKVLSLDGTEYVTTSPAVFALAGLTSSCSARAVQAGKRTQMGRNQLRRFSDLSSLFDQTIVVNNPEPCAGGEDREQDGPYKERYRLYYKAVRRATKSAIEFGALSVAGVTSATAVEALSSFGLPARVVQLAISDSSGLSNEVLGAEVGEALDDWRAYGIAVLISLGQPQLVPIVLRLRFLTGINTAALSQLVRAAVVDFVNSLGVNSVLSRAELMSVLVRYRSSGLVVLDDAVVEPAGDLIPDTNRTIRTRPELVTQAA